MQNEKATENVCYIDINILKKKTNACETKLVLVSHLTHVMYFIKSPNVIPSISLH